LSDGFRTLVVLCPIVSCSLARPTILAENNIGYWTNLYRGAVVGSETLLSLMGYYEESTDHYHTGDTLDVDPVEKNSQTFIKVVVLGLGRTGTTSLAIALEILGYTVIHDDEHVLLIDVMDAVENEVIDVDEFHDILGLRGYNVSFKTGHDYVVKHPEIKGILTVRDTPEKYVDSWLQGAPFVKLLEQRPFCWMENVKNLFPSFEAEYKWETTGGSPEAYLDRETLKANYVKYVEKLQQSIPPERLLTFNVKQGWEPLCKYLGHPIPDGIPFPHVHTRSKLQGEMYFLQMITWIWPLAIIIPLIAFTETIAMGVSTARVAKNKLIKRR